MSDDEKIIRIDEAIIVNKMQDKNPSIFAGIDVYIDDEADRLITLGEQGTLDDFIKLRPINPSIVHRIIEILLSRFNR